MGPVCGSCGEVSADDAPRPRALLASIGAGLLVLSVALVVTLVRTSDQVGSDGPAAGVSATTAPSPGSAPTTVRTPSSPVPVPSTSQSAGSTPNASRPFARDPLYFALVTDEDSVYAISDQGVIARRRSDLSLRWVQDACYRGGWASPFVHVAGGRLLLDCGGELGAIDTDDGHLEWTVALSGKPEFVRWSDTTVVVLYDSAQTEVYDAATGALRWTRPTRLEEFGPVEVVSDIVLVNEYEYLRAFDAVTGEQLWQVPITANGLGSLGSTVVARSKDHRLHFLDLMTGAERAVGEIDDEGMQNAGVMGMTEDVVLLLRPEEKLITAYSAVDGAKLWSRSGKSEGLWWADIAGSYVVIASGRTGEPRIEVLVAATGESVLVRDAVQPVSPWIEGGAFVYASTDTRIGIVIEALP